MNPHMNAYLLQSLIILSFCFLTSSTASVNKIAGLQFWGTYTKNIEGQNFDYLDSSSGSIIAIFYGSPDRYIINSVDIYLLDPKYYDQKIVILQIRGLLQFNETDNYKWTNTSHSVTYTPTYRERNGESVNSDRVSSTITFSNVDSENIGDIRVSISMKGQRFGFQAQFSYFNDTLNCLLYVFYVSAIIIFQIYCGNHILKKYGNNQTLLGKMSQITIGMCGIIDFTYAINFIQIMMGSEGGILWFALPSISFLVLFVLCDMKLMFLIWKSRNMGDLENQDILRKRLTTFYIIFYLGLFLYLTLEYFFSNDQMFIILSNIILLPQIIHNVRLGARPFFNNYYIVGYLATRILLPLYDRSCPQNYFKKRQDLTVVLILVAIYLISILLLYFQYRLGSRFFLPKQFLTAYHQYQKKLKLTEENQNEECSICLQNIFLKDFARGTLQIQSLNEELLQEAVVMHTPCNHLFHQECLNSWMDVKLECPKCRARLPLQ